MSAFAAEAGIELYRELLEGGDRGRERDLLRRLLLSDDEEQAREAAAALAALELLNVEGPVVVLLAPLAAGASSSPEAVAIAVDGVLARIRRQLPPRRALHLVSSDHALLLGRARRRAGRRRRPRGLAERLRERLGAALAFDGDEARQLVAVGAPAPTFQRRPSYRQALQAASVAAAVDGLGDVVALGRPWRVQDPRRPAAELWHEDLLHRGLVALLASSRSDLLVSTLEAFLDNGGDVQRTSAACTCTARALSPAATHRAGRRRRPPRRRRPAGAPPRARARLHRLVPTAEPAARRPRRRGVIDVLRSVRAITTLTVVTHTGEP